MNRLWGYTFTEKARDAGSITYNVKVSPLRLAVDIVRTTKPRHVPLMLALLAVATIRARWRDAIALVGLAVWLAFMVGCAASPPSLRPIAPHLVERAEYGQCAETGGKIEVPQAGVVALLTSVCWMRADSGAAVDAAPEPVVVIQDKADAGAAE